MTLVFGSIRFIRIFAGVLGEEGVKRQWVVDTSNCQCFRWLWLWNFRNEANITTQGYGVPRRLSSDSKTREMTLNDHFTLNSVFLLIFSIT